MFLFPLYLLCTTRRISTLLTYYYQPPPPPSSPPPLITTINPSVRLLPIDNDCVSSCALNNNNVFAIIVFIVAADDDWCLSFPHIPFPHSIDRSIELCLGPERTHCTWAGSQNPGYMKENFVVCIESLHVGDVGDQKNVSVRFLTKGNG